LFSRLSEKIGNINTLKITIVIWGFICVAAYLLDAKSKSIDISFMLWEPIGMVLGQFSLYPSTSKLLPKTEIMLRISAFFDVTEKIAIVVGTFVLD
jgi:UMF1 family MFS transporter